MPLRCATHDGPFHADDVLAFALIRAFSDPDATVTRTRDTALLDAADLVFDVGGSFDPAARRFDHHQASYTGPLSSAGMVLDWLMNTEAIPEALHAHLHHRLVAYVDDVDNGRVAPIATVPCFPSIVDAYNQPANDHNDYDSAFLSASHMALGLVQGLASEQRAMERARGIVQAAMDDAVASGRRVLFLDAYVSWKTPYFELGGADHPTDFVVFPATDGSWRIVCIAPQLGSFAQKRPLPEAWAGLTNEALEAVTGIEGSVFCHKNRFIAVFKTREGVLRALTENGMMHA
jgi:uncharacterized UPF0160 family protein